MASYILCQLTDSGVFALYPPCLRYHVTVDPLVFDHFNQVIGGTLSAVGDAAENTEADVLVVRPEVPA